MKKKLILGTRGSKLALWQANFVKDSLEELGYACDITKIVTKGDAIQHLSFDKIEGKGFFTKEIEDALFNESIDFAVHSMKDMPTKQPEGLVLAGISKRANPADWLIIRKDAWVNKPMGLPQNAVVGTSSARRKAMITQLRPDLQTKDIRGNVPTRLAKLKEGNFDAILLAAAGLNRLKLDLSEFEVFEFNPKEFIPAPAQGVLTYQCRQDDIEMRKILAQLHDAETLDSVRIERDVLKQMDGGCHIPLGVYVHKDKNHFYHGFAAYAAGHDQEMKVVQHSSSSNHDMANQLFEKLNA